MEAERIAIPFVAAPVLGIDKLALEEWTDDVKVALRPVLIALGQPRRIAIGVVDTHAVLVEVVMDDVGRSLRERIAVADRIVAGQRRGYHRKAIMWKDS